MHRSYLPTMNTSVAHGRGRAPADAESSVAKPPSVHWARGRAEWCFGTAAGCCHGRAQRRYIPSPPSNLTPGRPSTSVSQHNLSPGFARLALSTPPFQPPSPGALRAVAAVATPAALHSPPSTKASPRLQAAADAGSCRCSSRAQPRHPPLHRRCHSGADLAHPPRERRSLPFRLRFAALCRFVHHGAIGIRHYPHAC